MYSLYIDTDVDVFSGFQHDFHTRRYSCRLTVTQGVTLVEQELLTRPYHLSSHPFLVGFS